MTQQLVEAVELYDEDTGNLSDDLREHDREDLMNKFGLDYNEAGMLALIIKEDTDIEYCAYGLKNQHSDEFLEMVQESIHQSFDGPWSDYDRIVIRAYLADLTHGTYLSLKGK